MTEEICKLIKMYETEKSFVHIDVTDDMIREAETRLGVTIPLQYQEYLKQFGHGASMGWRSWASVTRGKPYL